MNWQKLDLEKALPVVMVMEELPKPRELFVLKRGQYDARGEAVSVGVPAIFPPLVASRAAAAARFRAV